MKYSNRWTVGEWTFYQVEDHGFSSQAGRPLFSFTGNRQGELYSSLEHAMVAAIAEKYTGRRGAGGTGVGTAADWFMRMIGADQPTRQELIEEAAKNRSVIGIAEDAGCGGTSVAEAVIDALGLGRKV